MEQRLCHEAEYFLHQLLRHREMDPPEEEEGDSNCVKIELEELLQFQKIRELCSSAEKIRYIA